ncbi:immunity 53 family protein [Clostridium swellfunianum]|uniref:Imm53 family immunity protein n=1 Tax=Clostridium swellfunianum TaxID=1367462 RepID=UPI00202FA715|nr:Imm53 family immunity protein [Clostridium swellfunianum]MCM0647150.1 immunity 53 family protein [Clostridium swellfunianum]
MSVLSILQNWYENIAQSSCSTGIQIETISECGWYVCIDLFDTLYEAKTFDAVSVQKGEKSWIKCTKENALFKGYGGVQNLEDILGIFYNWIVNENI